MSDYLRTIFHLAEAADFYDDDDAEQERIDNLAYERKQREDRLEAGLREKLHKMGISLLEDQFALTYDEENRELNIKVDDNLNFQQIQALASLGSEIKISAHTDPKHNYPYLNVEIRTHEGIAIR